MSEYRLERMTQADAAITIEWMVAQYGFDRQEVEQWVEKLDFDWPLSVKAIDEQGEIIGLLNMSGYRIEQEAEDMPMRGPKLLAELNAMRYTAVFSFVVRQDYRGTRLNYDMINWIVPEMRERYDFVFIPVMHRLKTHQYWQRWGAREFYRDKECVYYRLMLR